MRSYYNEGKGLALIFYILGKQQGGTVPPVIPAGEWKTIVTDTSAGYLNDADMKIMLQLSGIIFVRNLDGT